MPSINNKNIVNVIVNNPTKTKKRRRGGSSVVSSDRKSISDMGSGTTSFTNTGNLQNEILRQSLYNMESPQIGLSPTDNNRFRGVPMINNGEPNESVDVTSNFEQLREGTKRKPPIQLTKEALMKKSVTLKDLKQIFRDRGVPEEYLNFKNAKRSEAVDRFLSSFNVDE